MSVFNCARTVVRSIRSIHVQTFANWELLIIDDGSTDDTLNVVREISDPRITVIEGGRNRGLPTRLNETVALAQGKYFARMDGDDVMFPDRLAKQVEFLLSHPEIDLVGGAMVVFRGGGEAYGTRPALTTHHEICARPWSGIKLAHPTWMGHTEWFRRNRYREDAIRMEDKDLLFRTYKQSRFASLPDYLVGYREDEVSLKKVLPSRKNFCKLLVANAGKHLSYFDAVRGLLGQSVRSLADVIAAKSGLNEKLLRHRARPLAPEVLARWTDVWTQTSDALRTDSTI